MSSHPPDPTDDDPIGAAPILRVGRHGRGPLQYSGRWPASGSAQLAIVATGAETSTSSWPAYQPGPLDAHHGWRSHRVEVAADIPVAGRGYELRLTFFASHGPCPGIEISIGEHLGVVQPVVRRDDRREVFRQSPIAGWVDLRVPVPGEWLPVGRHRIGVATVRSTGGADRYAGPADEAVGSGHDVYGSWFGSGISWDAMSLVPARPAEPAPVTLQTTSRFRRTATGLSQVLTLTAPVGTAAHRSAVVELAGLTHEVMLDAAGRDFGEVRTEFDVPELGEPAEAAVLLDGVRSTHHLVPGRKWTLHLVPHIHVDVGFTDHQGKVLELHSRNLDRAVAAQRVDPGFRFTVDGSMVVQQHLATRRGSATEPLLSALRSGVMGVNAFHSLFLSGIASLEECYRATYYSASLRAEHGIDVETAHLTDVPSYTAAMPSVLSQLGLTGFVGIANHGRGATGDSDLAHVQSPVMWEGVDGAQVLTYFADSYSQLRFLAADPQTQEGAEQSFDRFLARYERSDYLPHDLPIIGSHADNEDLGDGDSSLVDSWNAAYAYPRLTYSTLAGYLDTVRPLADRLPVWRGDGGSFWEDGVGAAAAVEAMYRQAQLLVPVAENVAALTSWRSGPTRPNRDALDRAWEALLIGCEHTWTWSHMAAHPHGAEGHDQLDWKRHQIHAAWRIGTDETRRALSQLGELITTDGPTLLVYNSLSWPRSADVEVELPAAARLLDGDDPVPVEVTQDVDGLRRLRLTVGDVPAFGYRTLRVSTAAQVEPGGPTDTGWSGSDPAPAAAVAPPALTSPRWAVEFGADGMLTQLTHRPSGRALLDPASPWSLGAVLYAAENPPGSGIPPERTGYAGLPPWPTTLSDRRPFARPFDPVVVSASMRPSEARRTYDGWRIVRTGHGPTLSDIRVEVLLRDDSDTVDVSVHFVKQYTLAKESVYVAFPFAAADPVVRYDRQLGWIDPARDHSPGACNEWMTTQYAVVLSDGVEGPAVAWNSPDAPLFTVDDVVRGTWPDTFDPGRGYLLGWAMNNHWPTNTPPAQEGPLDLRFSFTPLPRFDPARAARIGREQRIPVAVTDVTWLDKADTAARPLPGTSGTLVDLEVPDDVHATVAEAREPGALVVRLQELAGTTREVTLRHPHPTGAVDLAWADERPREQVHVGPDGRFDVTLAAWSAVTLVLRA